MLFGHEATMSFTGEEGLSTAHRFRPHVVICDIGLPTMDGYGVAQALRANPPLPGLHLVASSGFERPEVMARASVAGFDRFLAKPVRLAQITDFLAEVSAQCQTSDHGL